MQRDVYILGTSFFTKEILYESFLGEDVDILWQKIILQQLVLMKSWSYHGLHMSAERCAYSAINNGLRLTRHFTLNLKKKNIKNYAMEIDEYLLLYGTEHYPPMLPRQWKNLSKFSSHLFNTSQICSGSQPCDDFFFSQKRFDYSASSSIYAINELVGSSSWLFYSWVLDTHEQAVHITEHQGKDKGAIFPENGKTRHLKKTSTKIYKK